MQLNKFQKKLKILKCNKGITTMKTNTVIKEHIKKENEAYKKLQNLGFHLVKNITGAYLDFYGQWLGFNDWIEALEFINAIT